MKKIQDLKCLNGLTLKLLAMALMLCDHMWATVVPGGQWMTNLGRLAFPIFAFQIAEGYARTHNFKRYLGRMFLFALISELPFNLMTGGGLLFPFHQNVMFTFCLALLMLRLADLGRARGPVWHGLSIVVACGLGWLLGTLAMVDYSGAGVLMVMLLHDLPQWRVARRYATGGVPIRLGADPPTAGAGCAGADPYLAL